MPYTEVPAFMGAAGRDARPRGAGVAPHYPDRVQGIQVLDATSRSWRSILTRHMDDPERATKMGKPHPLPLSDAALAIIKAQSLYEMRGRHPHLFRSSDEAVAWNMNMAMLLRRMGVTTPLHGLEARFATGRLRSRRPNTRPWSDASAYGRQRLGAVLRPQ